MCNIDKMLKASVIRENRKNMRQKIISQTTIPLYKSQSNLPFKKNSSDSPKCLLGQNCQEKDCSLNKNNKMQQNNEFFQNYDIFEKLGQGANCSAYRCKQKKTNTQYAVKINRLRDQELLEAYRQQFQKNKQLKSNSIIRHEKYIMDYSTMTAYSILEYCDYKNLKQILLQKSQKRFAQKQVLKILHLLFQVLSYLHKKGLVHRDIKPQNLLYSPQNGEIRLLDFDSSRYKKETDESFQMWTKTGTLNYEAPQIFQCPTYNEKIDIWAAGILAYELLTGKLPFYSQYSNKTVKMIISGEINYQILDCSNKMKVLLKGLLEKDSKKRLSAEQAVAICSDLIK